MKIFKVTRELIEGKYYTETFLIKAETQDDAQIIVDEFSEMEIHYNSLHELPESVVDYNLQEQDGYSIETTFETIKECLTVEDKLI